jgi:hypothetical protein
MFRPMRSALLIAVSSSILALAVPSGASASGKVTIGDQFHSATLVHPHTLSLWASDGLVALQWKGWGSPTAKANGKVSTHPYGQYSYSPAQVVASRRRACGSHTIYTRLRYTLNGRWHSAHLSNCRFTA